MEPSKLEYAVGQQVAGKVEKLLPYGVFVRLGDGTQAYIRRRELSWAGNIDPRIICKKDDEIEGKVIELAGRGQIMELSHRVMQPDPWLGFERSYRAGDVVEGVVKSITGDAIFVEIVPGVDGLLPLSELATWPVPEPEDLIWVGDVVEAVIVSLDGQSRRLKLSVRARIQQLEVVAGIIDSYDLFPATEVEAQSTTSSTVPDRQPDSPVAYQAAERERPPAIKRVGRILVIDDCLEFRQPLVAWLRHFGYTVDETEDAETALEMVEQQAYGLLFVDLHLPGRDGLTFLETIDRNGNQSRAVIMSSAEWLPERNEEIERAGVLDVFIKPLDLNEVELLLARLGRGEAIPHRQVAQPAEHWPPVAAQAPPVPRYEAGSFAERISEVLQALWNTTRAGAVLIFRLDPISRAVSITAQTGDIELNEDAIHTLSESPVRDVIDEDVHIFEDHMRGQTQERFKKLLALLPFKSCIGVPVKAKGELHHALFLLHPQPEAFSRYHRQDAVAAAALLSLIIERETMEQRLRRLNKLMLSGQLAGGFSHEVANKISGLELQLENLRMECASHERDAGKPVDVGEVRRATEELLATFDDLRQTVASFQQLMQVEAGCRVSINRVVSQAVALLRPVLHKKRIKLETELAADLPLTTVNTVQVKQAFLNVLLNAMQHMELKSVRGKLLTITTSYQSEESKLPLKIRFTDTGLGIHRQLWEKIFSLGFTTRLGGTGQGLFISRSLIESQGGRMSVERSVVPLGSTFLVELPLVTSEER